MFPGEGGMSAFFIVVGMKKKEKAGIKKGSTHNLFIIKISQT